jgi:hypothetical protein
MRAKPGEAPELDRALWFEHLGCRGRHYLIGNPHTVPGRMFAWCPRECCSVFVSRADIGRMSRAARYWIEGFLHGNEPAPPSGPDGPPDFSSRDYRSWRLDAEQFRSTGEWPTRRRRRQ